MTSAAVRVHAMRVVATIATWRTAQGSEPAVNSEGMPENGREWLAWHTEEFLPALFAMQEAIGAFNSALNRDGPEHPLTVQLDAERILKGKQPLPRENR